WNAHLRERHGLNADFEQGIVSGAGRRRSPQESIVRYTLDRLGCPAGECVFVDNSAANLRVAEKLGIRTVHFNRDGEDYEGRQVENFRELAEVLEEL
ncbi:MAG: HAD-IA family hydrolase, partial [Acetatifactor sp.]|nr:HAD-IA family hydrolase [Acetatifactor sp.]